MSEQGQQELTWKQVMTTGSVAACAEMIRRGGDVNDPNASEEGPPLAMAASSQFRDVVTLLLKHGADPDQRNRQGVPVLHHAAQAIDVCQLLLAAGANPGLRDYFGYAALHHAAMNGHTQVCRLLVERDESVDACLTSSPPSVLKDCRLRGKNGDSYS